MPSRWLAEYFPRRPLRWPLSDVISLTYIFFIIDTPLIIAIDYIDIAAFRALHAAVPCRAMSLFSSFLFSSLLSSSRRTGMLYDIFMLSSF